MRSASKLNRARWVEITLAIAACSAAIACGSDSESDGGSDLLAGGRQGIYAIESSTVNESGCDSEGPSRLDTMQAKFVFLANDDLGIDLVWLGFCLDAADCRKDHSNIRNAAETLDGVGFVNTGGAYTDDRVYGGSASGATCMNANSTTRILKMSDTGFVYENRNTPIAGLAPAADGSCKESAAQAAAATASCKTYTVYRGSFAQPL
jgi:hypothetical protein